ncbi:MAG: ParB/RepB/Spo0J family partition protein [Ignavibacteria bacterium]|jgi:ParB family chromosome partitioning protein|nr:ParB/RepB/Spo0J family partition protein [Ignavibacteria bacterium]
MAKPSGLGKGLGKGVGALIQSKTIDNALNNKTEGTQHSSKYEVIDIDVNKISVNPLQPRREFDKERLIELKDSILKYGLMNPITVKETIGGYEIVAGERRYRAHQLANLSVIPAIVTSISSNAEQLEKALIENIQREDLNPLEIANSYKQLIEEFQYTQEQLSERVGKERSTVANFIRLLKLPLPVQDLLLSKKISMGHARALLALDEHSQMISVANDIIAKGLPVRATEILIRNILSDKIIVSKDGKKKQAQNKQTVITTEEQVIIEDFQNKLRNRFGTNVRIFNKTNDHGSIEIEYYSKDDFDRIFDLLCPQE